MESSSSDDEKNLHTILRMAKQNKQRDKQKKNKVMNSTKVEICKALQEMAISNQKKPARTSRAPNEFKCRTCKEVITSPTITNYQSNFGTRMVLGTCPTCSKAVRKPAGLKGLTDDEKRQYYQQKLSALK